MKNSPTPLAAPPFVTAGPWIVLSGQVGVDADWQPVTGGVQDEIHAAFANVRRHLAAAGATMSDIVKVTCYLSDLGFFPDYNQVWSEVFGTQPPARTTFQVGLHPPFRVELDVTAYRPVTR
ncbi:RidA family protein [Rhodococcus koreensis]|uniref:RidA family protein n=1 Tax=Rhodococcus sp. T2V TaxID=3034164 RepID=UPI0023E2771E|nr:RidA family protein [Rhodococcus sp. T2V]MDF3307940.1 RidA family protein [Rhodococcus sp. T2V]